jgi:penicillin-binding protein 2
MRTRAVSVILAVVFAALISRLFFLQVVQGPTFARKADSNYIRMVPARAPRGIIFDRSGKPLVKNSVIFDVAIYAKDKKQKEAVLRSLTAAFPRLSFADLEKAFKKNYVAPFLPTSVIETTDRDLALSIEERQLDGIYVFAKADRFVPKSYAFAHVVGYVNKPTASQMYLKDYGYALNEDIGQAGIENQYDDYLRGRSGGRYVEVNAKGRIINVIAQESPQKGKDIRLTIDSRMQEAAYDAIKDKRGSFLIMDLSTGGLLACVSTPSFDVNRYRRDNKYILAVSRDTNRPAFSRFIKGQYPIGSVFKVFASVAGFETKKITPETSFLCTGVYNLGRASFKCMHVHGWENNYEALLHSCNVYFYNLGVRLGPEALSDIATDFGFGQYTGVDLPGEKKGTVPSPYWKRKALKTEWFGGDTVNFSIGQGYMLSTPLQVLSAMATVALNGEMKAPHLIDRIGDITIAPPQAKHVAVSPRSLSEMKKGLRGVVAHAEGTARILEKHGLSIAGKTGTAQDGARAAHGLFACYFPYDKPRYAIVVALENVGSSYVAVTALDTFLTKALAEGYFPEFSKDEAVG